MRFIITLIFLFSCLPQLQSQQKSRVISGVVFDAVTGAPVAAVNIFTQKQKIGTASELSGRFLLRIADARDVLLVHHIGYFQQKIVLPAGQDFRDLRLLLKPKTLLMPEVGVQAERVANEPQTFRLSGRFLKEIPDFAGESLAAVKTFPGVSSNNEMSNQFSVQGGGPDENLILLEDIIISRSQRIRSSSHENISPINRMLLQDLQFTAGAYPAPFGDRLSSVLVTRYRTSAAKKLSGEAEIGFLNISGMLAGQPDSSFYWAVAGRYADRMMVLGTLQTEGELLPRAFDAQAVISYRPSSKSELLLLAIHGENQFASKPESFISQANVGLFLFNTYITDYSGYEDFSRKRSIVSAIFRRQISPRWHLKQSLSLIKSTEREDVNKTFATSVFLVLPTLGYAEEPKQINDGRIRRLDILQQNSLQTRTQLIWQMHDSLAVQGGVEFSRDRYRDDLDELEQESAARFPGILAISGYRYAFSSSSEIKTRTLAGFTNLRLTTGIVNIETGLRLSHYQPAGELLIKPRLGVTISPSSLTKVRLAYGQFSQPPAYLERRTTGNRILQNVPAQRASHLVAGVQHFSRSGAEYQLQVFYKKLPNMIPYKTDDLFVRYEPELKANARIYGASAYWKGQVTQDMTSWFSYTYLFGEQDISGEGRSRLPFDQRHAFSCVIQDNMPRFPNSKVHLRFLFGSGYPYTFEGILYNPLTGRKEKMSGKRNALRLPFYRRIDMGYSYDFELPQQRSLRLSFDLFNIFDFRNILGYGLISNSLGHTEIFRYNLSRRFYSAKVNIVF